MSEVSGKAGGGNKLVILNSASIGLGLQLQDGDVVGVNTSCRMRDVKTPEISRNSSQLHGRL